MRSVIFSRALVLLRNKNKLFSHILEPNLPIQEFLKPRFIWSYMWDNIRNVHLVVSYYFSSWRNGVSSRN